MKTELKKIDQHKRGLSIHAEGAVITQKFDEVYKKINKDAKVPGFRAGNVPRDILEKHYAQVAHEQALKELLPELYQQALQKHNIEPISYPKISQVNLHKDSLSFNADVEVKPEVDIKKYKYLNVTFGSVEVVDDEIDQAIKKLKEKYEQMSDEQFIHSLGYTNNELLRQTIKKQIYLEKMRTQQLHIQNELVEQLLKQVTFSIPEVLVNQQLESLLRQAEVDLVMRGMPKEEVQKQMPHMRENLMPQAKKQTRIFLILEEIAKRENIERNDMMSQKVIEFLLREAQWNVQKNAS